VFRLKANGTKAATEILAGLTTFCAMAYIIAVNPTILSTTGMQWGAVFLATIISAVIGTLVMGLYANVPYAQAPGMGLNAFFTYTVVLTLGFTWQQALSMVFLCGLINILITVTKVRKHIIKAIPAGLQHAIGGGIGIFIAYIGLLNVHLINFSAGVPALANFNQPVLWVFLTGLMITIILMILKVRGAILIGIIAAALMARYLPGGMRRDEHPTIDYLGMALLSGALISLLLTTVWGGRAFPWLSIETLGLLGLSVVLIAGFIAQERRALQPIVPLELFRDQTYQTLIILLFLTGIGLFGAITFVPLYLQAVLGISPTASGLLFLPTVLAAILISIFTAVLTRLVDPDGRERR
jgi:xanthine/uracil/vitamin C permease (AzgA family)